MGHRRRHSGPPLLTLGHIWNAYDAYRKQGMSRKEAIAATERHFSYCDGGKGLLPGDVGQTVAMRDRWDIEAKYAEKSKSVMSHVDAVFLQQEMDSELAQLEEAEADDR